jgi:bifunctional non-homologous end joining protein LigD
VGTLCCAPGVKIATYNVNGIKARLPVLLRWLEACRPEVVCLQELKAGDDRFPVRPIRDAGYGAVWHGQKSWNGVAILAKGGEPEETARGLPGGGDDAQSRYLECRVGGVLVGCLYLPNGNPAPGPKLDYKLRWLERLREHAKGLLSRKLPVVLAGDFNVIPSELDVYRTEGWEGDALFRPEVRAGFAKLLGQGWIDGLREFYPEERIYTFWDYLRNAWGRNAGLRIDHLLLAPELAGRLVAAGVDREVRGWENPSDHAPVWIELATEGGRKAASRKAAAAPLAKYRAKRDFGKTPEPAAGGVGRGGNVFVIQEHHARSHHFDLRLEMDGVLVSWAVPKGMPTDLVARRLAVHVEDHPREYGEFEGEIPKGNYGAGTVKIWDKGEWEPLEACWRQAFAKGTLKFHLHGGRLDGVYLLARMKEEPNWMLKMLDPATHPVPGSVPKREEAGFVSPQLAQVVPAVPSGSHWVHEIKLDGYRLVAVRRKGGVRLFTRNGHDWTERFGSLAGHLEELCGKDFVLDGEAVVFDERGRSSFGGLQEALQDGNGGQIVFVAFDLLHFDGMNLRGLPLRERQQRLAELVEDVPGPVRLSKVWPAAAGKELFRQACANGLEGIISKKVGGSYVEGGRRDWVKSKCRSRQEFILCGYTASKGSLPGFGAVVLGSFENGRLVPRGKVGTGFSDGERRRLAELFQRVRSDRALFATKEKDVQWMKPQLVAEIEFAEITRDGSVRQGSFIALREDKLPGEVHLDAVQISMDDSRETKVAGVAISHPERLVYPGEGISKIEVARHYERVGELMMPFVAGRPLALLRAPEGITGEMFFQKSFPHQVPKHVRQSQLADGTKVFHVRDTAGLVSLAQFGAIEFHPWGAPLPQADRPDYLTWDLDPDDAVPWPEVLGAAFLLRDFLAERGLSTVVKTSGGKGLHLMLRMMKTENWDTMRIFTKGVSAAVAALNPRRFVITSTKAKRAGKIYIDWMRNGRGQTCIAPWAVRARPGATVSMPLNWSQLPEASPAGYTLRHPPEIPDEWMEMSPQRITKALLREFGAG